MKKRVKPKKNSKTKTMDSLSSAQKPSTKEAWDTMLDATGKSANQLLKELTERGYDRDASLRFAKAAKSWCVRDSAEWSAWDDVIKQTTLST